MNKERREELYDVIDALNEASCRLSEVRDEEQDAFDNLPEGLQCSRTGDSMQEAIDTMDSFDEDIQKIMTRIEHFIKPSRK